MRPVLILNIIVILVFIGTLSGCGKTHSSNNNGSGSNSNELTTCEKAAQEWGKIWTAKPEETGLTGDTPINDLMDIWGSGPDDIYVVGFAGTILHFNGTAWTKMTSNTNENLHGVWGYALEDASGNVTGGEVFAVGENGVVLRYSGGSWAPLYVYNTRPDNSLVKDDINDVWGIAPTDANGAQTVIAVGADGLIISYNSVNKTFEEIRQQVTVQHGLDAYGNQKPDTIEYHRWVQDQLNGVFYSHDNNFVAVGNTGVILNINSVDKQCDNQSCRVDLVSFNNHLNGVWGQGGELYAVGLDGSVVRDLSDVWSVLNLSIPKTYLRSSWSFYQEKCGSIPEGKTDADRPTSSWRIYVGWEGSPLFEHNNIICPLDSITANRLEAVWGVAPRSLQERTSTDTTGATVTACDPIDVLVAGVNGTLIRLTNKGAE